MALHERVEDSWHDANQAYLMARVAAVLDAVAHHASQQGIDVETPRRADVDIDRLRGAVPGRAALDVLAEAFSLSPFEEELLLLACAPELEGRTGGLCAAATAGTRHQGVTFGLALAALDNPHWSAITPSRPLRRWHMIELGHGDGIVGRALHVDEVVLHYLAGVTVPDPRLAGIVEPAPEPGPLPPRFLDIVHSITRAWAEAGATGRPVVIELSGSDPDDKRSIAAEAYAHSGLHMSLLDAADLPAVPSERADLARACERHAVLSGVGVFVTCDRVDDTGQLHNARAFLNALGGPVIVSSRGPLLHHERRCLRIDVVRPTASERAGLLRDALGPAAAAADGAVDAVAQQFELGVEGIRAAVADIALRELPGALDQDLWDACRARARPVLDELAQRIEPAATWDDLVLPTGEHNALRQLAAHARFRVKVYDEWGFAQRGERGLGISALFAGPSGTGKTMAAEVLANELRLDLHRVDLSAVVSKFIGETEKNLRRVFDAAEGGGSILLFDEADALFGKRSEVKDSHDRFANIEISYLLQRMETYRGIAILTTNLKAALDSAFLRRLRFVVNFPFPGAAHRSEIWRRAFPEATPLESIDVDALGRLQVAGGNIRNIALHAAFLAASAGEVTSMRHLARAARIEYAKLEKPLPETEVASWA